MAEMERKKRAIREYGRIFLSGFIMGSADVVPGVSGGTMAFILGIYQELIDSIRAFLSPDAFKMAFRFQVKKAYRTLPWPFLLSLGLGILTAIVLLSSKIKWMLDHKPALIWSFFFGLVLASIFAVFHAGRRGGRLDHRRAAADPASAGRSVVYRGMRSDRDLRDDSARNFRFVHPGADGQV